MKKNDIIELYIADMGVGGEGIGRADGMTFFVKDAITGDYVSARITKLKKNYGYARVERILKCSPDRIEPPCAIASRCGGCQIQAMSYEGQLCYKYKKVRENLIRLGGFESEFIDSVMEPVVGMADINCSDADVAAVGKTDAEACGPDVSAVGYRYRNKAQFPIGRDKNGNIVAGFYAARTHSIIPVDDCLIGAKVNSDILQCIISYMNKCGAEPYDEVSGTGLVRHVLIRCAHATDEISVCIIINGTDLPHEERLVAELGQISGINSISVNINMENTNVIMGDATRCIWGTPYITDYIYLRNCGEDFAATGEYVAYQISPQSFYQVNPTQTEKLYSLALEYAGLTGNECVWDLYCGIGTISLFLAKRARQVYGVEIVPQAIEDAKRNARLNDINNAEFFVGKAEEVLPAFYETTGNSFMRRPDVMVVDPPRKGCDEKCLDTMIKMQPERIIYISCDPATLARDLKVLRAGGYAPEHIRPVDCFCNTTHVETVVLMSKVK